MEGLGGSGGLDLRPGFLGGGGGLRLFCFRGCFGITGREMECEREWDFVVVSELSDGRLTTEQRLKEERGTSCKSVDWGCNEGFFSADDVGCVCPLYSWPWKRPNNAGLSLLTVLPLSALLNMRY